MTRILASSLALLLVCGAVGCRQLAGYSAAATAERDAGGDGPADQAAPDQQLDGQLDVDETQDTSTPTDLAPDIAPDLAIPADLAPAGQHLWSDPLGSTGDEAGYAVAIDAKGDVIVTGSFKGTINLGGDVLLAAGGQDIFIAKFKADGSHSWSERYGGKSDDIGQGVAVAPNGDVTIVGTSASAEITFGTTPLKRFDNTKDIVVATFDGKGKHRWSDRFGGPAGLAEGRAVAVDGQGNVTITGQALCDTINFGGSTLNKSEGSLVVASFDVQGKHRWSDRLGGVFSAGNGIAATPAGDVTVAGVFQQKTTFNGTVLNALGGSDILVLSYDSIGTPRWGKSFGGSGADEALAVAIDGAGNATLVGSTESSAIIIGSNTLSGTTGRDVVIASLDSSGAPRWSSRFDGTGSDHGRAVAVDDADNVTVVGVILMNSLPVNS